MMVGVWVAVVYAVGMAAVPCVLSFIYGKPWATRNQSTGEDFGVFITMLLWPAFLLLLTIRAVSCIMSDIGVVLFKMSKRGLDALKETCDDRP